MEGAVASETLVEIGHCRVRPALAGGRERASGSRSRPLHPSCTGHSRRRRRKAELGGRSAVTELGDQLAVSPPRAAQEIAQSERKAAFLSRVGAVIFRLPEGAHLAHIEAVERFLPPAHRFLASAWRGLGVGGLPVSSGRWDIVPPPLRPPSPPVSSSWARSARERWAWCTRRSIASAASRSRSRHYASRTPKRSSR